MVVVVPTPLLLKVPALVKRPALPPKLLLLMSASSSDVERAVVLKQRAGIGPAAGADQ